jgi:hypothetical protein
MVAISNSGYAGGGMPLRQLIRISAGLLAVVGLGACGGSAKPNGIASRSPQSILQSAVNAAESAHSVHLAGTVIRAGQQLKLDVDLVANQGSRGMIAVSGLSFQFIQTAGAIYIKADRAFLAHFGNPSAMRFNGRWLKASPGSSGFGSFTGLTDLHALFHTLLGSHGALSKSGNTTFNGQSVVAIKDNSKGSTLYVASTGPPYPVGLSNPNEGQLRLDHYNESVSLTAPSNPVDLSALGG